MVQIPQGRRGPSRKLNEDDIYMLASFWMEPENNRTDLAQFFGMSRFGAQIAVKRYLEENPPASLSGDPGKGQLTHQHKGV